MTLLPVVGRELIAASRNRQIYRSRFLAACAAAIAMVWVLIVGSAGGGFSALGKSLFQIIAVAAFCYCTAAGLMTADQVSFEKREGTLGLLFLTSLKGYDVIFGKLAAAGLGAFYGILGLLPVLSIALLLGGLEYVDVGRIGLVWVNALFVSLTLGISISTISINSRRATLATIGALLAISLGPYFLAFGLADLSSNRTPWSQYQELLLFSPARSLELATEAVGKTNLGGLFLGPEFATSLLLPNLLAWAAVAIMCVILPAISRDRARSRVGQALDKTADKWSYGEGAERMRRRAILLDENPYLWLCGRHRRKRAYVWFFLLSMAGIWCWAGYSFSTFLHAWGVSFVLLFGVHAGLKVWLTAETCQQLGEDRRSSALELILSTPLGVQELFRGHELSLRRMFARPLLVLMTLEFLVVYLSWNSPETRTSERPIILVSFFGALALFCLDGWAIRWTGLWFSMISRTPQLAINRTIFRLLLLPTMMLSVVLVSGSFISRFVFQSDDFNELVVAICWIAFGSVNSLWIGLRSRRQLHSQFRTLASEGNAQTEQLVENSNEPAHAGGVAKVPPVWRRHKIKFGFITILTLLLAFVLIHRTWWEIQVQRQIRNVRAQGVPTNPEEWSAMHRSTSSGSNAFDMLNLASTKLAMGGRFGNSSTLPAKRSERLDPKIIESLKKDLAMNAGALRILRTASDSVLEGGPTPEHVDTKFGSLRFNFWALPWLLQKSAYLELEQGNGDQAAKDLTALVRVGLLGIKATGYMGSYSLRITTDLSVPLLERLLTRQSISLTNLERLAQSIPDFDRPAFLEEWIKGDCYTALQIRENLEDFQSMYGMRSGQPEIETFVHGLARISGLQDRDFSRFLHGEVEALQASRLAWKEVRNARNKFVVPSSPWIPWMANSGLGRSQDIDLYAAQAARWRCAKVALEVEKQKLMNKAVPASRAALFPKGVPEWCVDPETGLPLVLERTGGGYAVYAASVDGQGQQKAKSRQSGTPRSYQGTAILIEVER